MRRVSSFWRSAVTKVYSPTLQARGRHPNQEVGDRLAVEAGDLQVAVPEVLQVEQLGPEQLEVPGRFIVRTTVHQPVRLHLRRR